MTRRRPYTRVEKYGQLRPDHVAGKGDVVYKGFQCLNSRCQTFIIVPEDETTGDFEIICPTCQYSHQPSRDSEFFKYRLVHSDENQVLAEGKFLISHAKYINEAPRFKYCLLCYTLKPLDYFDSHKRRRSGRQGECKLCKTTYNQIKNPSRITDQHREAARHRKLYEKIAGEPGKIDSKIVFQKFKGKCFNCRRQLHYTATGQRDFNLDHTLPIRLFWPLTTENATLLCSKCNNEKHDQWPSQFYNRTKLKSLARLTNYTFELLAGEAAINETAVQKWIDDPDAFIEDKIDHPDEIRKIRQTIKDYTGKDLFHKATTVPAYLRTPEELNISPKK